MMLIFILVVKKLYYVQFSYFLLFFMSEFNPVPTNYPNYTFHIQNSALFSNLGAYDAKLSKKRTPPISGHFALAPTVSANWREYCISSLRNYAYYRRFEKIVHHLPEFYCGKIKWEFSRDKSK